MTLNNYEFRHMSRHPTPPHLEIFAALSSLVALFYTACDPAAPWVPPGTARRAAADTNNGIDAGIDAGVDAGSTLPNGGTPGDPDGGVGSPDAGLPDAGILDAGVPEESNLCAARLPWVTVPLRVHLLESAVDDLDARMDAIEFRSALDDAARFWVQACIRFSVESIRPAPLSSSQEQAYRTGVMGGVESAQMYGLLRDAMPTGDLMNPGWNVMVFRRFPRFSSGVYMWDIRSVLWAEELPAPAGGGDNFPIILAHELGHSLLGLEHYEGTDVAENLMSQQIMQQRATAHGLTPEQITRARQQAASGDTFLPGP